MQDTVKKTICLVSVFGLFLNPNTLLGAYLTKGMLHSLRFWMEGKVNFCTSGGYACVMVIDLSRKLSRGKYVSLVMGKLLLFDLKGN